MRLDLCVYTPAEVLAGSSIMFAGEQLRHPISKDWFASMGFNMEHLRSTVDRVMQLYRITRARWLNSFCDVDFLNDGN